MVPNVTVVLLIVVTLSAVTAQTFQYSRGWTNGKRDGHRTYPGRTEEFREISSSLERILTPCQMAKLKYLLEGKPLTERLFSPCDYIEEDDQQKRYKNDHSSDLFDAFQ